MGHIYVVGTADTKGEELAFLAARIREAGGAPLIVDVGTRAPTITPDIPAPAIPRPTDDRGTAVTAMAEALAAWLPTRTDLDAVDRHRRRRRHRHRHRRHARAALRRPEAHGLDPRLRRRRPLRRRLRHHHDAPRRRHRRPQPHHPHRPRPGRRRHHRHGRDPRPPPTTKPAVGLTMFGVTTPCVTRVADTLARHPRPASSSTPPAPAAARWRCSPTAACSQGLIDATTTEIADELVGGVLTAGPDRLGAVARTGLPWVGAPGALDMVNFWAPDTIPDRFTRPPLPPPQRQRHPHAHHARGMPRHRRLHRRRSSTPPPARSACSSPSAASPPSTPPAAPSATRPPAPPSSTPCESAIRATPDRQVIRLPLHINDPEFADALVAAYRDITEG